MSKYGIKIYRVKLKYVTIFKEVFYQEKNPKTMDQKYFVSEIRAIKFGKHIIFINISKISLGII